jgi:hypothetical protein
MAEVYPPTFNGDEKDVKRVGSEDIGETVSTSDPESSSYTVDKQLERKLLRKFDFIVLPLVAVMYLFKYAFLLDNMEDLKADQR